MVNPLSSRLARGRLLVWGGFALLLMLAPLMATMGAQGVLGVALVPVRERCAVFSIGYSLAMALFAGTAPLMATWLVQRQHWAWGTPLYALLYGLLALWAVQASRPQLR